MGAGTGSCRPPCHRAARPPPSRAWRRLTSGSTRETLSSGVIVAPQAGERRACDECGRDPQRATRKRATAAAPLAPRPVPAIEYAVLSESHHAGAVPLAELDQVIVPPNAAPALPGRYDRRGRASMRRSGEGRALRSAPHAVLHSDLDT